MLEWIKRKIGIQETNEETEEKQDIDTAVAEEAEEAQDEAAENVQEAADSVEEAADNEAADLIKHKAYDFSNAADEEAGNVEPAEESDEAPTEGMPEEEPEEEEPIEETILPEEEYDVVAAETDSTAEPETDAEEDRMEASEASPENGVDEDKAEDVVAAESEASSEEVSEPEDAEPAEEASEAPEEKVGWFARLKQGLEKTRDDMNYKINDILGNYVKIDDDMMEDLEDLLISSDMGMETTMTLIDRLKDSIREKQIQDPKEVKGLLAEEIRAILEGDPEKNRLKVDPSPAIILIVGVNGVGKTTTIGKLAYRFKSEGKSVLIAAADTFRAAAIEQIETWGERSGTPVISHKEGADPAAVVYDAIQAQKSRNIDVLICDTAGRLHNKKNLMNELEKIHRIIEKEAPDAQKESLLVLDATTGQNAILQAKTFNEVTDLSGLILTKLDGTAKGGVVLPLVKELEIPIKLIGVGEGMLDLQDFSGKDFANALINAE
ncbi:signal recognition particle-docking protein FtsY [Peptoniphilus sp. EMRHCC_23]|uniref:signal recognition particle-docking protein FtsY n=1 Tax=Peptoniphilus rachelemmaiella TaxID=2811779 RepID=UPI001C0067D6|nr:signal recognition particle-docking protein FtsY [Peptoniphilus rachelemmaiella]